jgi:hypothetical protein
MSFVTSKIKDFCVQQVHRKITLVCTEDGGKVECTQNCYEEISQIRTFEDRGAGMGVKLRWILGE